MWHLLSGKFCGQNRSGLHTEKSGAQGRKAAVQGDERNPAAQGRAAVQSALPGNVFARTALPFVLAAAAGCSVQALAADAAGAACRSPALQNGRLAAGAVGRKLRRLARQQRAAQRRQPARRLRCVPCVRNRVERRVRTGCAQRRIAAEADRAPGQCAQIAILIEKTAFPQAAYELGKKL